MPYLSTRIGKTHFIPPSESLNPDDPASVQAWTKFLDRFIPKSFFLPEFEFVDSPVRSKTWEAYFSRLTDLVFFRNYLRSYQGTQFNTIWRSLTSDEAELLDKLFIFYSAEKDRISPEQPRQILSWCASLIDPLSKRAGSHQINNRAIYFWQVLPATKFYDAQSEPVQKLRAAMYDFQDSNTFFSSRLRGILAKFSNYEPGQEPTPEDIVGCINQPDLELFAYNLATIYPKDQLVELPGRFEEALLEDLVGAHMLDRVLRATYRGVLTRPMDIPKSLHATLLTHADKEIRISAAKALAFRQPTAPIT